MHIIPWITIGLNILILSIIANGNPYKLKYVHVMFDQGQTVPDPMYEASEDRRWWDRGCSDPGCMTETTFNMAKKFVDGFFNKYSDFVGRNEDKYSYNFGKIDTPAAGTAINQLLWKYFNDPGKYTRSIYVSNRGDLNADYRCSKRNKLMEMARYHSMTDAEKVEFDTLINDMRNYTKEDVTAWNHLEYIKGFLAEVTEYNPQELVDLLSKYKDIIIKSFKISMGLVDTPIIQGNITIDEEIRQSRVKPTFWYHFVEVGRKEHCLKVRTCDTGRETVKLGAYATTATTINAMLMGLGLTKHINQSIDFYPKAGSNLVIELYAKTDNSMYFKVLLSRDRADAYKDLTKDIQGCEATEYCDFAVLDTLYRSSFISFECRYDRQQYFVPKSTTTSTSDNCKTTHRSFFNFF